jgi:nucleoside-diphosphate-sugar epimerase
MYDRLCESLQIDIGKARQVLGWSPVQSVDAELARTASWYLGARANGKRDEDRT